MTGEELKAARQRLGLGVVELGRKLGYTGKANSVSVTVRRYERSDKIPDHIAATVRHLESVGSP